MSTKIYDGCKLKNTPKNLKEVRDVIFKFKKMAMEYYREKYYKLVARDIVHIFDDALFTGKVFYQFPHDADDKIMETFADQRDAASIWGLVYSAVDRRAEIFREQRDRFHDFFEYEFYCNITVLPCNDEVFLMIFTEENDIKNIFLGMDEIEEYPYWDNTDQPEGMTWEEWEERGKEWDEALGDGVPSQNGFGIDILSNTHYLKVFPPFNDTSGPGPVEEILKHIPDFKDRVKRRAMEDMHVIWGREQKEENDALIKERGVSAVMTIGRKFDKFIKDNPDKMKTREDEIAGVIKKDFTREDISIRVADFTKLYNIVVEEKKEEEPIEEEREDPWD